MTTELQAKLEASADKLITFLEQAGSATIDFTKEQVPLVVEEMLRWGWWSAVVPLVVVPSVAVILGLIAWRTWTKVPVIKEGYGKGSKDFDSAYETVFFASLMLFGVATIGSIPTVIVNGGQVIKITVAPRLYIIDQLKEIAK